MCEECKNYEKKPISIMGHKDCYKNRCDGCRCRNCNDFNECDSPDKKCGYCKYKQSYTITWPYHQTYTVNAQYPYWGYDGRGNNVL